MLVCNKYVHTWLIRKGTYLHVPCKEYFIIVVVRVYHYVMYVQHLWYMNPIRIAWCLSWKSMWYTAHKHILKQESYVLYAMYAFCYHNTHKHTHVHVYVRQVTYRVVLHRYCEIHTDIQSKLCFCLALCYCVSVTYIVLQERYYATMVVHITYI